MLFENQDYVYFEAVEYHASRQEIRSHEHLSSSLIVFRNFYS
jgi:hypothetical protein